MGDDEMLSERQGFEAMLCFLEQYWKRTGSSDIAGLLGSLSIQADGKSADPAMWDEWISSCGLAKAPRAD